MGGKRWTVAAIQAEALKYVKRVDFQRQSSAAYQAAQRKGIVDDVCTHMPEIQHRWTKEEVAIEALKFKTRSQFQRGSPRAYKSALAHGWLDEVCLYDFHRILRKWTDDEVYAEALQFDSRSAFSSGSGAYAVAQRRGILDEVCAHMSGPKLKWTLEALTLEAAKYRTRKEFQTKSNTAYTMAARKGLKDIVCAHMDSEWREVTDDEVIEKSLEFTTLGTFYAEAQSFYTLAVRRGMIGTAITHLERHYVEEWTLDAIRAEAKKYSRRSDFSAGQIGAYAAAHRLGVIDDVCGHMQEPWADKGKWSDEYLHSVALKYETKVAFVKGNKNEYQACYRRNLLASACAHMVRFSSESVFGFQPTASAQLYIVLIDSYVEGKTRLGFGISKTPEARLSTHQRNLNREGYSMRIVGVTEPMIGYDTSALEDLLYEGFEPDGIPVSGFKRECVADTHLPELISMIECFSTIHFSDEFCHTAYCQIPTK